MKRKRLYYPKSQIKKGLYTRGNELMEAQSGKDYIGSYHYYITTSEIYSLSEYNERLSVKLIPIQKEENSTYMKLRGNLSKQFKGYKSPISVYSPPTEEDYKFGSYVRYFSKKVNDINSKIIEIDKSQYDQIKNKNGELDFILYMATELEWKLTGKLYDVYDGDNIVEHGVYDTNKRLILSKSTLFKNLNKFLTNPIEYARISY